MNKRIVILFVFFNIIVAESSIAQRIESPTKTGTLMAYKIEKGDTVYYSSIPELIIRAPRKFKNAAEERQFWKLVYNVKKVYPYAKLAGKKLQELNDKYMTLNSEKDRAAYSKKAEKELMEEFEGKLRKLTITQGRILMRLVDRETGYTTFEIVKEFRGGVQATAWQAVARVFGSNLKKNFDPSSGEDKIIERILREIDEGWL